MKNLIEEFGRRVRGESGAHHDIKEHLQTLRDYANGCSVIAEFGTRTGNSTVALALGLVDSKRLSFHQKPELHCYDLDFSNFTADEIIRDAGVDLTIHTGDTSNAVLPNGVDLLFIDTLHTYEHVKKELATINERPRYLIFHDVETFGSVGEGGGCGIIPAIMEFMEGTDYFVSHYARNNNGLLVLSAMNTI